MVFGLGTIEERPDVGFSFWEVRSRDAQRAAHTARCGLISRRQWDCGVERWRLCAFDDEPQRERYFPEEVQPGSRSWSRISAHKKPGNPLSLNRFVHVGCIKRCPVTSAEFRLAPPKLFSQARIFLMRSDIRNGTSVCVYPNRYTCAQQPIGRVIVVRGTHAGLHVAAGTKLKMNAFGSQVLNQLRILDTPHPMSDPCRFEGSKRLPYTGWSRCLSGMSRAVDSAIQREAKRGYVRIKREPGLISSQIKSHHTTGAEPLY